MNRIEIHIIAYNEHIMLPFTIAHYKRMFGNPTIIVHDNRSIDDTAHIAVNEGATVIPFITDGMNDTVQSEIKSKAVMEATADWVLCIDADEECMINSADLDELDARGVNIVHFEGWNIFDEVSHPSEIKIPMGIQDGGYSKPVLMRSGIFETVRFAAGAHSVILKPKEGKQANYSKYEFKLLHYKHWSCTWNLQRSSELAARQSPDNKTKGHSFHFALPKSTHEGFFKTHFENRKTIVDKHIQYPEGVTYMDLRPGVGEILVAEKNKLPDGSA